MLLNYNEGLAHNFILENEDELKPLEQFLTDMNVSFITTKMSSTSWCIVIGGFIKKISEQKSEKKSEKVVDNVTDTIKDADGEENDSLDDSSTSKDPSMTDAKKKKKKATP